MKRTKKSQTPQLPDGSTIHQVQKFIATVNLSDIFLKSISGNCIMPPSYLTPEDVHLFISPSATFIRAEKSILVWSTLRVEGVHKREKAQAFIFEQVLGLLYECKPNDFDDSIIQIFATKNGTFNAWPYHRELLASTMSRMGLPACILPLLNPYKREEEQPKTAVSTR